MKGKDFKVLCRRVLGMDNAFQGKEMPDDWEIQIGTKHGVEKLDTWMDDGKATILFGESSNNTLWKCTEEELPEPNKIVLCYWYKPDCLYRLCYLNEDGKWMHPLNGEKYECVQGGVMKHMFDDNPYTERRICYKMTSAFPVTSPDIWTYLPDKPKHFNP